MTYKLLVLRTFLGCVFIKSHYIRPYSHLCVSPYDCTSPQHVQGNCESCDELLIESPCFADLIDKCCGFLIFAIIQREQCYSLECLKNKLITNEKRVTESCAMSAGAFAFLRLLLQT